MAAMPTSASASAYPKTFRLVWKINTLDISAFSTLREFVFIFVQPLSRMKTYRHADLAPFYARIHTHANKISERTLLAFTLLGALLAAFYQTWGLAIAMGGGSLALYHLLKPLITGRPAQRYVISLLYGNYVLQFVLQMHGSYEWFFVFFFALTLLLFFEDWKTVLPITAHHAASVLALFALQKNGEWLQTVLSDIRILTGNDITMHLLIVLAYAVLCGYWSVLQRRQTTESAVTQLQMNEQLATMQINKQFADNISQGRLEAAYPADQEPDDLGQSLLNMRKGLVAAAEREEKERFQTTGLAEMAEILRRNAGNLSLLCDQVLEAMVKYMKANQGSLFLLEDNNGQAYLQLAAARAWNRKKFLQKQIALGDGLAGQAVLEKESIFLKEVPEDYISITSGLGEANPRCVLIVPLKSEEQVVGVLELAGFKIFSDHEQRFVEKVGESIAATILAARTNEKTRLLLEQSNLLTEQLKAQEEEIRQNMEEMQATQEEMQRAQGQLASKVQETEQLKDNLYALINNTDDSILAMDSSYRVLIINNALKQRYKGTQYENIDIGADALAALGAVRDEWKGYYNRALAGEKISFTLKSTVRGEDAHREYFINPMRDHSGRITGLSVFSRDVTANHRLMAQLARRGALLESFIQHNQDTYFAIDAQYRVMLFNEELRKRYLAYQINIEEGMNILETFPPALLTFWKDRYDRALRGEVQHYREERKLPNQTLFLDVTVEPVWDKDKNIIGCLVVSCDITEEEAERKKITEELERLRSIQKPTHA
jgi:PAS domain S-box-containing protein